MNAPVLERNRKATQRLAIADCDIHPIASAAALRPYLPERWREHAATFGPHLKQGLNSHSGYPRMMAAGQRADAYPAGGGLPGSDLELLQRQHLDVSGVEYGMLMALGGTGQDRNRDYGAAISRATNDWQMHDLVAKDSRLYAGICVPTETPDYSVSEIERLADHPRFVQVIISPRSAAPLGQRQYWPIYAAAEAAGLPIGIHPAASPSGGASTGGGWPSYYFQEHYSFAFQIQANVASMIFEGVFEAFPKLRVALVESSFTWVPSYGWRMDRNWERMRKEVPHVKRPPSEYLREHFWYATQPIEEPETARHLEEIIDWIGWDRLMFSSDYPHWDYDDPRYIFKFPLSEERRTMILRDNAKALYRLT